ncbi:MULTISPECIES: class I SAM-dependent methyltransferase [unclassified Marinovum]
MADYYDKNAWQFLKATRDVDMTALRTRFLEAIPKSDTRCRILDAGAGSGRDAHAFRGQGYQVEAFDASRAMVQAASALTGISVRHMRFEDFQWDHSFEGIWACASLLHVARCDLPGVILRLGYHLVPQGVLYASFKLGIGERISTDRHFTDMNEETFGTLLDDCPTLRQVATWRSEDRRSDRKEELWFNALLRKS